MENWIDLWSAAAAAGFQGPDVECRGFGQTLRLSGFGPETCRQMVNSEARGGFLLSGGGIAVSTRPGLRAAKVTRRVVVKLDGRPGIGGKHWQRPQPKGRLNRWLPVDMAL